MNIEELKNKIGPEFYEDGVPFRMINGRKVSQLIIRNEQDKKINDSINLVRASGLSPAEFLKQMYG